MDFHRVNDFLASSICYTRLQKQIKMDEIAVKFAIAKILRSEVQDLNKGTNELTEIYKLMEEQFRLHVVSQQSELLELVTEIANSKQVYSNTRHKLWAKKLISSNCG